MDDYRDRVEFEYLPKRDRRIAWAAICAAATLLVGILVGFSALAHAQKADPLQSLSLDWQSLATAQGHVATGIQDLAQAYQAAKPKADKLDALDAYWKAWCGEKPGCAPEAPK